MDPARHAGVAGHVLVQGRQQGVVHACINFSVLRHGRLPQSRQTVQHNADGLVLDVCLPSLRLLFLRLLFFCRVPGRFCRELPRRQLRPSDIGRKARRLRPSWQLVWGRVQRRVWLLV
jgi:hypothetical protein